MQTALLLRVGSRKHRRLYLTLFRQRCFQDSTNFRAPARAYSTRSDLQSCINLDDGLEVTMVLK